MWDTDGFKFPFHRRQHKNGSNNLSTEFMSSNKYRDLVETVNNKNEPLIESN